jgi:diguanylate cyclase (GGDEF)-like protein
LWGLPQEYKVIFRHLHKLVVRLAARHRNLARALDHAGALQAELHNVLEQRERQIEQRTMELARANQELEILSRTDALTQLFNRRWFEHEYERMWRTATRDGMPISIVLLDVDFFKRYNDCYGHPAGDEVLRQIARALQTALRRPLDIPARYGGEEFVIVLGDTDVEGALDVAERVRMSIAALNIEHCGSPHGIVTVSIGVCALWPSGVQLYR